MFNIAMSLLFAGPVGGPTPHRNWPLIYAFAATVTLITLLIIYMTRTIPHQLARRKQMLLARWLAPLVGLIAGGFGAAYNGQARYLTTVPIFLTCILEILLSVWVWHEVNVYAGRHRKLFSRKTNKMLVILSCIAMTGLVILGGLMHMNNRDSLRRAQYRQCLRDFEGHQGRMHNKYYAYKKALSASNLDYKDLQNDATARCGQDPQFNEIWAKLKLRRRFPSPL